ncbi:MAG: ribonuclease P protein component [Actinomycetota bacterium]|nr:ribonuclease P protein component [Actinomycetota bacterium]
MTDAPAFRAAYSQGRRARRDGITVFVRPVPERSGQPARVGLAVKSEVGTAVTRNRLKRRLKAILAERPPACGLDVVVRAERGVGTRFQELETCVVQALSGAGAVATDR